MNVEQIGKYALGRNGDNRTIYGYSGSAAEQSAVENGLTFVAVSAQNLVTTTTHTTEISAATTSVTTTSVTTTIPKSTDIILGDFTSDGIIDGRDATDILTLYAKSSSGGQAATAEEMEKGDVTKDGVLDGRDATAVLTYYAKSSAGEKISFEEFLKIVSN